MELYPLIPIGTQIKVKKSTLENNLPNKILNDLPPIINGEVIDYKMTDGMDIGYVLITEKKQKIWIFNNELDEQTKKEYNINREENSTSILTKMLTSQVNKFNYEINGNRKIKTIVNPVNLISWLIFTLKDTI